VATSEDIVRLNAQFLEILKRVDHESLTLEQVREAFQVLITAQHAKRNLPVTKLGLDEFTVQQLQNFGVWTTLGLARYDELSVVRILKEGREGYPVEDGALMEAIEMFELLRTLIENRGLKFQGPRQNMTQILARI
jgi:glutaredoxin 2